MSPEILAISEAEKIVAHGKDKGTLSSAMKKRAAALWRGYPHVRGVLQQVSWLLPRFSVTGT